MARAVRFRIMTLMVLLLVVIFAMKEAGKPARWMWMGFDQQGRPADASDTSDVLVGTSGGMAKRDSVDWMDGATAKSASRPLTPDSQRQGETKNGLSTPPNDLPAVGDYDRRFWVDTYRHSSGDGQRDLFGLLRKVIQSDLSRPANGPALEKLLKRLARQQTDFQTLALNEIALLPDHVQQKRKTVALFEFDRRWQKDVLPALTAAAIGKDFAFAGQVEVGKVNTWLRELYLNAVEDLAGMGTRGDLQGWLTVWDDALARHPVKPPSAGSSPVSFLQVSGQPKTWRGKAVNVSGQARTCRKKVLEKSQLPVNQYYEVWVEPLDDDGDGLFCVYTAGIPDSFPQTAIENQPQKFHKIDIPVSLRGQFFKIRSYRDSAGGVSHSPVVIARRIDSVGSIASAAKQHVAPGWKTLVMWFVGVAVLATSLAIVVFRSSRTQARAPGKSTARRMQRALEMLAQDHSIKSPAQRVAELTEDGDTPDE